jgi:hypothetical protein
MPTAMRMVLNPGLAQVTTPLHQKGITIMRNSTKVTLTALVAALAFACALGTASARNLSVSNQNFRIVWTPLTFTEGGIFNVRCNVTLEGSFHYRTIVKAPRALIGWVTRAIVSRPTCVTNAGFEAQAATWNGTELILGAATANTLPWHVTYEGFNGTLPTITGIRVLLRSIRFTLEVPATGCLGIYGEPNANIMGTVNVSGGVATTITPGTETLPVNGGGRPEACPARGGFTGNGTVTLLGNTTRITVTLI